MDFGKIRAFVFDVDGVLTDGGVYAVDGDLYRRYDTKDGLALRLASLKGYKLAIISSGRSDTIIQRFTSCGFEKENIHIHCIDKRETFLSFCSKYGLDASEAIYCGDDLPDIPALEAAGIGACPADAASEVLEVADYVSPMAGGQRFVREVIEKVMRARGDWGIDLSSYKQTF